MSETCPRCDAYVEIPNAAEYENPDYATTVRCPECGLEGDVGIVWEPIDDN